MSELLADLPRSASGYDFAAEAARLVSIPDVVVRGRRLNRGTARVAISGDMDAPRHRAVREAHAGALFPSTIGDDSPTVELGWPQSGPFVMCGAGVYMDLYLAVAQKLLDPMHPRVLEAARRLDPLGLLVQREINTDDFLVAAEGVEGLHMPQDFAAMAAGATASSFPGTGAWKAFLSNSGTEAIECALKIAWQVKYKRFVEAHGMETLLAVAKDLGIALLPEMDADRSRPEPVLADYPFFVVGCWRGFHGRTLGSLHYTTSKKAQRLGYPQNRWTRRVEFNGGHGDVDALVDPRGIREILAAPGGVRAVVEAGRIPKDLFAGFLVEPLQGEGGYRPADRAWIGAIAASVRRHGGLFLADEVQTVGRTGTLFFAEQCGIQPDVVATAKGMWMGVTLARAEFTKHLHPGWHANTWGGGKIFDNQVAYAVLDTLLHHKDPVLGGLSYLENCRVKGERLEGALARLQAKHPRTLAAYDVRGLMAGLSVRRRADVVRVGWKRGLKLLGCGLAGEVSRLRVLFLADSLAREIDEAVRVLDEVLTEVEALPAK
jgi:4-aminobutyrate aminotransferase-like enzyme